MTRPGYKMTEIGEIPEDWDLKRIRECAEVKYGRSNPKTDGMIPLIGSSGVFGAVSEPLIYAPTIVIGRKGTAGAVWDIRTPSWPSDTAFYLEYKTEISQKFLFEFMSLNKLTGEHAKTTLPSVKREEIEEFLFPFPPLPEQKKIAEILSTADETIQKVNDHIIQTERLEKGLMQTLLTNGIGHTKFKMTDIGEIPEEWPLRTFSEVLQIRKRKNKGKSEKIYTIPMELIPENGTYCDYRSLSKNEVVPPTYCERGDILLPKITPSVENGKQGIVPTLPSGNAFATSEVYALVTNGSLTNIYTFYLLKLSLFRKPLIDSMVGTTGRQRVPKDSLFSLSFPVPPIPEQQKIAEILTTVDYKLELLRNKRAHLVELKKGMMEDLLTGRVRVKV